MPLGRTVRRDPLRIAYARCTDVEEIRQTVTPNIGRQALVIGFGVCVGAVVVLTGSILNDIAVAYGSRP
jgi:hypothetical protein